MAEGCVAAREHDALDDQHVPDPERPPARPAAEGALGESEGRDERHDADPETQFRQVVGAEEARQAEVPVAADQEWHEEQFQVVPRQRSRREATEGDGRSLGFVHEAESWKPLGGGKAHCEESRHHHGDAGDCDTPARTPCSPADSKEVRDHDDRDTGGGARVTGKHHQAAAAAQQRNPSPSCAWLGRCLELVDGKQHPGSEAHALHQADVHGLAAHEPGVSERQRAQQRRERRATEPAQEYVQPDTADHRHRGDIDRPGPPVRQDGEEPGTGVQGSRVPSGEQLRPAPDVRVPQRQMTVPQQLTGQHP